MVITHLPCQFDSYWTILYSSSRLSRWLYQVFFLRLTDPLLERFTMWRDRRREEQEVAEIKKDPDAHMAKVKAMEAARIRMQEKHLEVCSCSCSCSCPCPCPCPCSCSCSYLCRRKVWPLLLQVDLNTS